MASLNIRNFIIEWENDLKNVKVEGGSEGGKWYCDEGVNFNFCFPFYPETNWDAPMNFESGKRT